jgi:hypothetical protein
MPPLRLNLITDQTCFMFVLVLASFIFFLFIFFFITVFYVRFYNLLCVMHKINTFTLNMSKIDFRGRFNTVILGYLLIFSLMNFGFNYFMLVFFFSGVVFICMYLNVSLLRSILIYDFFLVVFFIGYKLFLLIIAKKIYYYDVLI